MFAFRLALVLLLGSVLLAQRGGSRGVGPGFRGGAPGIRTYGSPSGFGNILHPGVGTPPPIGSSHAARLGGTIAGFPPFTGGRGRGRGPVVFPYAFPVIVSDPYGYGYQPQPNVTVIVAPPQQYQQPAPVIINQSFAPETARPTMQRYEDGQLPSGAERSRDMQFYEAPQPRPVQPVDDKPIYLVALKDNSISAAYAYWVKEGTLHYITLNSVQNRVSMELVDIELTKKLNQDRETPFSLDEPK